MALLSNRRGNGYDVIWSFQESPNEDSLLSTLFQLRMMSATVARLYSRQYIRKQDTSFLLGFFLSSLFRSHYFLGNQGLCIMYAHLRLDNYILHLN